MEQAKSVDPLPVARALENGKLMTDTGEVYVRPDNHQLVQPLFISTFAKVDGKAVKFDNDRTGFGFRIDRKVEILYGGTSEWIGLMSTYDAQRERRFNVTIRIGYFTGDHEMETMMVAADDEHQICKAIMVQANWPTCTSGCVEAYMPQSSSFQALNEEQWVLEIEVLIQVKA
jgi:hypothetical protein